MAVKNELFLFEVVLQKLNPFVEERLLVLKGDFANIFSLELKDPKTMRIIIPEPLPLPPEPPGKKKKKKKPKPKKKKGKKGKEPPPPPEPEILAGQSVLITSSAEVLVQNMKSSPLEVSLWSKEENLTFIGASIVPWDEVFLKYLERVYSCVNATPPIVKDDYNIFEENTGKLIAKMTMQVKLTYLTDRIVSSFRTITEDPVVKKVLYTGMNSKTTSYMCTLKTTDEEFETNIAKIPNKYIKDKQTTPPTGQPVIYADYTNAPGAVLPFSPDGDYCCKGNADKPVEGKTTTHELVPDIDYICEYVRKIISSCNDNMRMLTPRPTIQPRMKATDLDKLCYCRETNWPQGDLAERFKRETQGGPCPICIRTMDGKARPGTAQAPKRVLDIANIRGPCGRPDCRIARDIRAYLEKIVDEDNKEIILDEIVGPCGSKECTLVDKIKDFLQHRGKFTHGAGVLGMGTQCACLDQMQKALIRSGSCTSVCSHECESDESDNCGGRTCPYKSSSKGSETTKASQPDSKKDKTPEVHKETKPTKTDSSKEKKTEPKKDKKTEDKKTEDKNKKVYYVYYFTVEYSSPPKPGKPSPGTSSAPSKASTGPSSASGTPPSTAPPSATASKPSNKSGASTPPSTAPPSATASKPSNKSGASSSNPTTPTTTPHSKASSKTGSTSPTTSATTPASPAAHSKTTTATTPATHSKTSTKTTDKSEKSTKADSDKKEPKLKYCADKCPSAWLDTDVCSKSVCGIAEKLKASKKPYSLSCTNIKCPTREAEKQEPRTPSPADSNVELNLDDIRNACCVKSCDVAERVKDVIMQGVQKKTLQKDKFDLKDDPCFCDCVCNFPIGGQTTYCSICGGYETCAVAAVSQLPGYLQPHPCPVYHKLQDINVLDMDKGKYDESDAASKASKVTSGKTLRGTQSGTKASIAGEKLTDQNVKAIKKKMKKKGKVSSGLPNIGRPASHGHYHNYCFTHFDFVPKNMGWLWTAEDIPGMKPRPKWRPGAANKILVRRYRTVREGVDIILKKKRALLNRKKKIEMKPTLVITKKDGEFKVQMEIFKKYSKERLRHQYPYDEKPPLVYTIGKTDDIKIKTQKQRERRERREARRKNRMLQSAFRDKCQEICLKAYNQSLGVLPMTNPNNPDCPCNIRATKPPSPVIDSCSCSDSGTISSSDTDGDDWIIEFTPPMATWDTKGKHLPILASNETQYNYLDYKVKCLDKQGNQVPRYFKGPDGKEECSDLGGFWGPDKTWLEINKDGYIGPDSRWVPPSFTAPDGSMYMTEDGIWTDTIGRIWKIGIDGYIDKDTKWQWYGGKKPVEKTGRSLTTVAVSPDPKVHSTEPKDPVHKNGNKVIKPIPKDAVGTKNDHKTEVHKAEVTKKKETKVIHETESPPKKVALKRDIMSSKAKNMTIMNMAAGYDRQRQQPQKQLAPKYSTKKQESEKLARYQEIMNGLQLYEEIAVRPPTKTNRAVETRQMTRAKVPKYAAARRNLSKFSVYDSNGLVSTSKIFTR